MNAQDTKRLRKLLRNIHFTGTIGVFARSAKDRKRIFDQALSDGLCHFARNLCLTEKGDQKLRELDNLEPTHA